MAAVSLFTGAGGLDLGCEAAGFLTHAAVESEPIARLTLEANAGELLPGLCPEAIFSDVIELDNESLLDAGRLDVGETSLLHGGPPCTPFSKSPAAVGCSWAARPASTSQRHALTSLAGKPLLLSATEEGAFAGEASPR